VRTRGCASTRSSPVSIRGQPLGRDANAFLRFLAKYVLTLLAPHIEHWSTPKRAARVIANVALNEAGQTGVYYDERGNPMRASELVRDPTFTARVAAETRTLLASLPSSVASGAI
jgi:hypothetical protein